MVEKNKPYQPTDTVIEIPRFREEAGFYASAKSSATMKKIRGKNTKAEVLLRKALWEKGFRYRLYAKDLKGKPDVIFRRQKLAIFVDGDFWHGYKWEEKKPRLLTNKAYWIPKIERNMQRDAETNIWLNEHGWKVLRFWEHEVLKDLQVCLQKIASVFTYKKPPDV